MNLEEFLSPLIGLQGKPTIAKQCGVSYNSLAYGWLVKGFPVTELEGKTKYIETIAEMASLNPATRHITESKLKKYINNASGN